ncbi:PAS domain-containing sensor histidine kinase [Paraconexibacter sp. AEG42_29]|uniref:PAS domain-containing sensor histidine kinase n=1 Tax=Paraconexibacter sp. AEG42_29 TaxID=2997339 RepID=UPI00339DA7D7
MSEATTAKVVSQLIAAAPRELLEALLDTVADAIYLVDPDGRVEFLNPAALRVLGYDSPSELLGRISHPTIHYKRPDGSHFPASECPMLRPRVTGETVHVTEDWFVRRDGSMVPVAYSSAPLPMRGARGAVVAFRDISDQLAAEDHRRREAIDRTRLQSVEASRARIVAAADAERHRIGRDLHDGAQQRLVHLLMTLQRAGTQLTRDAEAAAAAATIDEAARDARAAIGELRDLVAGIHPAILTNRGLHAAIAALTVRTPVPVEIDVPPGRWPSAIEATAYFVVAEALTNVAKHAAPATHAAVRAVARDGELVVRVADDGPGGADLAGGTGLRGLEDRVAVAGGSLTVVSAPGSGTTVEARIPLATGVLP